MSTAYVWYIQTDNGTRKYYKNNETFLNKNTITTIDDAKMFFNFEHIVSCMKTFTTTMTKNKASKHSIHENKFEEFWEDHSEYGLPKIEELEYSEIYFTIQIKEKWLSETDDNEFFLVDNETSALRFTNYEDVKRFCKLGYANKWFTNSQVTVKHNFVKE
jgi:hypothetical protein